MRNWEGVKRWRRERRAQLIARRQAMSRAERRRLQPRIMSLLEAHFRELAHARTGFYWPIRGEIGLHPLIRRLVQDGSGAALPVVVEKRRPLEFWAWRPGDRLERGVWDIPMPVAREVVQPSVLLVPLVGFDAEGYRLGYGGGYYDRTLAAMNPKPLTIGVGYELGRLETIHPQPHDIPMDAIVTEAGVFEAPARRPGAAAAPPAWDEDPNATGSFASPPCFMHELDPAWLGLDQARGSAEGGDEDGSWGPKKGKR